MANIQISTPFLKKFVHADVTVGTSKQALLAAPTDVGEKRIVVIIQNSSSTANNNIQVWGDSAAGSSTNGIIIAPMSNLILDNYNGGLWCKANTAGTSVHIAYSAV